MAVLNYTRVCKICSKDFVRTEKGQSVKFCSDECKKENKSITNKSVPVEKKKEYQDRAYKKIKDDHNRSWAVRKQRAIDNKRHGPFTCKGCNKEFYKHSTRYTDYCSRECAHEHIQDWRCKTTWKNKVVSYIRYLHVCNVCDNRFLTTDESQCVCSSKQCSDKLRYRKYIREAHRTINCEQCNILFTKIDKTITNFCSNDCKKETSNENKIAYIKQYRQSDVHKSYKRIEKAKRRAIERGLDADNIDPIKIFERDKWMCHICNKKTDITRRGTYEDKAPELDHIISLADGGAHTFGNVACSCRKCNGLKGSKSFGQLSFGFV